ncbi:hypothetical protein [Enterococcus faecalis]|uniref:hypothetical protein n=1 Tax=Enterococcus faecalis TaxID=1351 RepID=UPI0034CD5BBB
MKNRLFKRRFSAVAFGFLASFLLGKGYVELCISVCVLAFVLFVFSYDLAVEDENIKRRRKFREIQRNSTVGK